MLPAPLLARSAGRFPALLTLVFALLAAALPVHAQLEEEDLAPDDAGLSGLQLVRHQLDTAAALFQSADQPDSIPLLGEIIDGLLALEPRSAEADALLIEALDLRSQASFNVGDRGATEADLRQLLLLRPSLELDPNLVSPRLLDLLGKVRKQTVGEIEARVTPPEASLRVGDQRLPVDGSTVRLLPGFYELVFERPGYAPQTELAEVTPGATLRYDVTLERRSAVLSLITRPAGVEVRIGDRPVGVTSGVAPEGWPLEGDAARFPLAEFSAELFIDGLAPGEVEIEMVREHHRTRRLKVVIPELSDYRVGAFSLEAAEGIVLLDDLPRDARVLVDDQPTTVQRSGTSQRITVVPGDHRLTVSAGTAGVFEQRLTIADRETRRLAVVLRPGISFLGVLGADERAARELATRLHAELGRLGGWALLERASEGGDLLLERRFTAAALRSVARGQTADAAGLDWAALQQTADLEIPGAIYLLAVLSDDLVATHADLWIWPAAPGPAGPDRWRLDLGDPAGLAALTAALERPFRLTRASLGGLFVDSLAATGPVVAHLEAGSPLRTAGVSVGDEILSLDGEPLSGSADLAKRISALSPGREVRLSVRGRGPARTVEPILAESPLVVEVHQPEVAFAAVAAGLAQAALRQPSPPAWLLALNRAVLHLHAREWDEAVRALRSVEAPARSGVGRGTADYLTGLALAAAGPAYRAAAREALERAAGAAEARLLSDDGPWVAPRARARLVTQGLGP